MAMCQYFVAREDFFGSLESESDLAEDELFSILGGV